MLRTLFLSASLLIIVSAFSQSLKVGDLINALNATSQYGYSGVFTNKGWAVHETKSEDFGRLKIVTYSYEKERYSDKALGWSYLHVYNSVPAKAIYSVFNEESYKVFTNSISSQGFKYVTTTYEKKLKTMEYENKDFILTIERLEIEEDYYTRYTNRIEIIKRLGAYDFDNGFKISYSDDNIKEVEYNLRDGQLDGMLKKFHRNGKLKKIGYYSDGLQNGKFKEYDDNGNLDAEYSMVYGKMDGTLTIYDKGKVSTSTNYKLDIKHGAYKDYDYNEENGKLQYLTEGEYYSGEKHGKWSYFLLDDKGDRIPLSVETYSNGQLNGYFKRIEEDSLVEGSYKNGRLDGSFRAYRDFATLRTSSFYSALTKPNLICEGEYANGYKTGYWKYYFDDLSIKDEGKYENDKRIGKWNSYLPTLYDSEGSLLPYSNILFRIEEYQNDKLNGTRVQFGFLSLDKFLCDSSSLKDTCSEWNFENATQTTTYRYGKLNGPYSLKDSVGTSVSRGNFANEEREGEWVIGELVYDLDSNRSYVFEKGVYNNDLREGKWVIYDNVGEIYRSYTYSKGKFDGDANQYDENNTIINKRIFRNGKLVEETSYDSLGKPSTNYKIFEENDLSYRCTKLDYNEDVYSIQEYFFTKTEEINPNLFILQFWLNTSEYADSIKNYKDGQYRLLKKLDDKPLVEGQYTKGEKVGIWTIYNYEQGVIVAYNFSAIPALPEVYYDLNNIPYVGTFVIEDKDENTREIITIKNGLRNGRTTIIDLETNEEIDFETYKKGVIKMRK